MGIVYNGSKGNEKPWEGRGRMKLRLRDIAERANVSPATVSNALNGRGGVSKAVQAQILAIAREMGYDPGRDPRKQRSYVRMIIYKAHGMVIEDTPFFSELTESVQLECRRMGLELLISHIHAWEQEDAEEQLRLYREETCAGMLLLGTEMNGGDLRKFEQFRSPLVVLDNLFRFEEVHAVAIDNLQAGYLAAQALYEAGHRRMGHICSSVPFGNMQERTDGFRQGLAERGISLDADQCWAVRPSISGAYSDMKALLAQRGDMPEAFFAGNDLMAIGCMRALTEAGYRIPEDISLLGMDDTSVCLACTPQLSTLRVYRKELGVTAIRTLLAVSEERMPCAVKTAVGVSVVLRDSIRKK